MLSIAEIVLLPIIFAVIIAIAISPAVNYLVKKQISRGVSIAIVTFIAVVVVALTMGIIISQISKLDEAMPQLTAKFQILMPSLVAWLSEFLNVSTDKINAWIIHSREELLNNSSSAIGTTIGAVGYLFQAGSLTVVYTCMILYYQSHLMQFVHKLFSAAQDKKVSEVLTRVKVIIQAYLIGLGAELVIVAALNSLGLFLLGIKYAILLGIGAAFLNTIPYIGGIIGVIIFMIVALLTKAPEYAMYVLALYAVIQFVDNNYIVPKIVGSKVKLNALVSIVAVIAGAVLWGIPGMFLSIPLVAIIKLICDNVDDLNPYGFLLGDVETGEETGENGIFARIISKFKTKAPVSTE